MIPTEIIEQVREAADLVQLIGEHVELKRTGSDWRGVKRGRAAPKRSVS